MSIQLHSIAEALLSPATLTELASKKDVPKTGEAKMIAVAQMIENLLRETIKNIEQRSVRSFDANPGDGGCQLRAFILRNLITSPPLLQEARDLKAEIDRQPLNATLLRGSREFIYVVQCHLLTVTKSVDALEESGVIRTKTSATKLSKFSSGMTRKLKDQMLSEAVANVSEHSVELIRKITLSPLVSKMLMEVHRCKQIGSSNLRSFGCLFFEMKAILTKLREEKALICIRPIVKDGQPSFFFLQPEESGKEFTFVRSEKVPPDQLLIVFAGVIQDKDFVEQVRKIGFTNLVLACASQEAPFEPGSTIESIQDKEALQEILSFQERAKEFGCEKGKNRLLDLDHVYCSTLQDELKEKSYVNF